jgi:VanZ family protein
MNSVKKGDLALWLTGWVFVAVVIMLSLVPGGYRPHLEGVTNEFEHVIAYAGTAGAFTLVNPGIRKATIIVFSLTALGTLLEIAQLMVPGRNASLRDIAADAVGALIGVGLAALVRRIFLRPEE